MKKKKRIAQILIVAMLAFQAPTWTTEASVGSEMNGEAGEQEEYAAGNPASPGNAVRDENGEGQIENGEGQIENVGTEPENTPEIVTATSSNATAQAAIPKATSFSLKQEYGADGEYQLEAEDESVACCDNTKLNEDGDRIELQQNGSVTFDLSKVTDFKEGKYLVSVNVNGSSKLIKLLVNNQELGTIEKEEAGWAASDLSEYSYCYLELKQNDQLKIAEGESQFAHLDWIRLRCLEADYWIEAKSEAAAYGEGAKLHADGDRAEINAGQSISFDLSKVSGFEAGNYELYAGVNGNRTQWRIQVDGSDAGIMSAPGNSKWKKGTCEDVSFGEELELSAASVIKLSDMDSTWGHVAYIRLVHIGGAAPGFDKTDEKTGIRVTAPEGVLPEGTQIQAGIVSQSNRKEIREQFREDDQKVFFYRFALKLPGRSRAEREGEDEQNQMDDLEGEVTAWLPIPAGYSDDCELYFAQEPEDVPEPADFWLEGGKLCVQMETMGGVFILADEDIWRFEGEKYYNKTADGGAAADLQPGEEIRIPIPDDEAFKTTVYNLMLRVCGGQNYTILVDGQEQASIVRGGTGWNDYEICGPDKALKLSKGQTITVRADDHYGWVDYISLKAGSSFEEEAEGVIVEAEAGVVPSGTQLCVETADETTLEELRELFGFAQENGPAMSFYRVSLLLDGTEVTPSGVMKLRILVPESFGGESVSGLRSVDSEEQITLYRIGEDKRKISLSFRLVENKTYVEFETRELGLLGLVDQAMGNELYYKATQYYGKTTGNGGKYADLQPEDSITIPVKDLAEFSDGNYLLSVCSSGNRTKFMVLVNGSPVGMISREGTGWEDMREAEFSSVLSLSQEDKITIYAPGLAGAGPYGWVDYVKLKKTSKAPTAIPEPKTKITLEAENFYPDELEMGGKAANVNNPSKKVEFPILASEGFVEKDYHFMLYTTGTMRNWVVCVNGVQVLSGTRDGSGYEEKYMTRELGNELIHLKPGDILTVKFMEQDTDNYGNWIDKIVLNSRRRVTGADFLERTGGRILVELTGDYEAEEQPRTLVKGGKLIYEGEAYYKAQNDNPAADLQPGEQILIPVSDYGRFVEGTYRLAVRSCGNREFFRVKVNGWNVGNISRKETGYSMEEMTEDILGTPVVLKPGDVLAIEGQTGGKYGWVDWISLSRVQEDGLTAVDRTGTGESYTWECEDYYTKQKDNPAADLQPGEEITIPLHSNETFTGGIWYVAVVSNGERRAMTIKKNGEQIGSIARNATAFDMGSMTMEVLQRPITLTPEDVISICAPEGESGPYGWVDRMILIPAAEANPQKKEEYRYPAWAYGTASMYLAAADLQPEEALRIPLGDDPSFMEGMYRIAVISNGSRERFDIQVNGQPVGSIRRQPSDYGDNGMSSDKLDKILYLKPSDEITVVGQEGDFFGWVSALVLESVE